MPTFDLRYIQVAKYSKLGDKTSYGEKHSVGDAMKVNLELKFAEGRLYAEGRLAEYIKLATGGTISVGVKHIPEKTQVLMYGAKEKNRTVNGKQVNSIAHTAASVAPYVGLSCFAPDKVEGETKYTCIFVPKASFGPPSLNYETKGQNIAFKTPTTTGEFLADDSADELMLDVAVCDTVADAKAWCDAVLAADDANAVSATGEGDG